MYQNKCPECGSEKIDYKEHKGECICRDCGLVVDDAMPSFSEYTEGNSVSKPQAVNGKIVKDNWLYSTKEKNLKRAKRHIKTVSSSLKLPDYVSDEAFRLFKLAVNKELNRGRDNISFIYASIYASCLINCIPKTALEITVNSRVSQKKLLRAYNRLKEGLNFKVCSIDPSAMIPRFGTRVGLKQSTITQAIEISNKVKEEQISCGRKPQTIASASIYVAGKIEKEKITQRVIANATGVLETTIRNMVKEIIKTLKIEF